MVLSCNAIKRRVYLQQLFQIPYNHSTVDCQTTIKHSRNTATYLHTRHASKDLVPVSVASLENTIALAAAFPGDRWNRINQTQFRRRDSTNQFRRRASSKFSRTDATDVSRGAGGSRELSAAFGSSWIGSRFPDDFAVREITFHGGPIDHSSIEIPRLFPIRFLGSTTTSTDCQFFSCVVLSWFLLLFNGGTLLLEGFLRLCDTICDFGLWIACSLILFLLDSNL